MTLAAKAFPFAVSCVVAAACIAAPAARAVVSSAYRAQLSVTNGTLLVKEFTAIQSQYVHLDVISSSVSGTYVVRISHSTNSLGTRATNFPLGNDCGRLSSSDSNVEIVKCSGVADFAYRGMNGVGSAIAPVDLGYSSEIPLASRVTLGSADSRFRIGPANASLAHVVEAGTGSDTLVVKRPNPAVTGPVFRYTGDGLANDGFDGLAKMNLSGFEVFEPVGAGPLALMGGSEANTWSGSSFADPQLSGGAGDDTVSGGAGDDSVQGNSGNDTLRGDAGGDHVSGGSGNDVVDGGAGADLITGSIGDDLLQAREGVEDTHVGCGDGDDRAEIDLKDPQPTKCETVVRMAVNEVAAIVITGVERQGAALSVTLACPAANAGACTGKLDAGKVAKSYSIPRGRSAVLTLGGTASPPIVVRSIEQGQFGPKTVTRTVS